MNNIELTLEELLEDYKELMEYPSPETIVVLQEIWDEIQKRLSSNYDI